MDLFDLVASIRIDTNDFDRGLENARNDVQSFSDGMKSTGQAIAGVGSSLTQSISAPLLNIGKSMLQAGMDYEAGMDEVAAISGAAGTEIDTLGDKAMEMAAKTKFSTAESAEAYKYMAMAGWKTEDMLNSLDAVMYLAGASGESLGTTSDIVTDAMTAFGLAADETSKVLRDGVEVEVSNAARFTDVLAAASNNANTNVSMLGDSFKYVAPVAGSMGYSIEDTAIALGLMANSGVKASMSGTALRSILTNLSKPTDAMYAAMLQLGVSLEDSEGNMYSLKEVMDQLRAGFGGGKMEASEFTEKLGELESAYQSGEMSEGGYEAALEDLMLAMYGAEGAQKAEYAATIAGKYGMAGLLAVVNATEEDYNKLTDAIYNSNGATEEMYNVMTDNAQGAVTMLDSAINVLFTSMSQHIIPIFTEVVRTITDAVNWFGSLDDETQKLILTIGGIAIAAGPVITVIGNIITAIGTIAGAVGSVISVVQNVGAAVSGLFAILAANPIAAVIAAVAALVAGLIVLWNTNEDFRNAVGAIWEAITGFFTAAVDKIKAAWEGIAEFFSGIWESISAAFQGVVEFFGGIFSAAAETVQTVWRGVSDFFSAIADGIHTAFETVTQFLGDAFGAAWEAVQTAWSAAVGFFTDIWNGIQEAFSVVAEVLGGFFRDAWDAVQKAWSNAKDFFSDIWCSIREAAEQAGEKIGDALKKAWDAVKSAWNGAKDFFGGVWSDIKSVFSGALEHFKGIGSNIVNGIKDGVKGAWSGLTGFLGEKVSGMISGVKEKLGIHSPSRVFAGIGENMALGLGEGWGNEYNGIRQQIERGMEFSTASIGLAANGAGYSFSDSGGVSNRRGGSYGGELQPVTIIVRPVLNEREIGEATYQYWLNRERAYGGR